jgi:FkbM family methyltransferase
MAERFDIYFSPLVPMELDGKLVLDFSHVGTLQTYADSGLQFEMASFPEESEAISSYFHWYTPQPGDTVFDIGAHCGVSTYHFSRKVEPTGKVIAFEPDPFNFDLLTKNINRHGLTNVTPVQIAMSDSNGVQKFYGEATLGSSLAHLSTRDTVGKEVDVETCTLEYAIHKWGPPQFCKIDIEGSEIQVIRAAQKCLNKIACQFAIDTNHLIGGRYTDHEIETLFRNCGYETQTAEVGMKTTWARLAKAQSN